MGRSLGKSVFCGACKRSIRSKNWKRHVESAVHQREVLGHTEGRRDADAGNQDLGEPCDFLR